MRGSGELTDEHVTHPVLSRETAFDGRVFDVVRADVDLGDGGVVTREYVQHPGAVAVVALDESNRVLLLRQYRVPVGAFLWEVPAGLLDVDGEPLLAAAQRELAEEADLVAARWDVLVDYCTTPGGSTETLRVFLARELAEVPDGERHVREAEELGMEMRWVDLDDAADAVLAGQVHNPSSVVGILGAVRARQRGWASLRAVDAPWFRPDVAPA